jgi:hypothetical protein
MRNRLALRLIMNETLWYLYSLHYDVAHYTRSFIPHLPNPCQAQLLNDATLITL